jgi:hypothetical protein
MLEETKDDFLVYGLPRSGTNYLEFMLTRNLNVSCPTNMYEWKHGPIEQNRCKFFIIYKDPFSWLNSMYGYSQKYELCPNKYRSISSFIRGEMVLDESVFNPRWYIRGNPVRIYNDMIGHYAGNSSSLNCGILNYESFMLDSSDSMRKICSAANADMPSSLVHPKDPIFNELVGIEAVNHEVYENKNFYTNRSYMMHFSKNDVKFVSRRINRDNLRKIRSLAVNLKLESKTLPKD